MAIFLSRRWRNQPKGAVKVSPEWRNRLASLLYFGHGRPRDLANTAANYTLNGSAVVTPYGDTNALRTGSASGYIEATDALGGWSGSPTLVFYFKEIGPTQDSNGGMFFSIPADSNYTQITAGGNIFYVLGAGWMDLQESILGTRNRSLIARPSGGDTAVFLDRRKMFGVAGGISAGAKTVRLGAYHSDGWQFNGAYGSFAVVKGDLSDAEAFAVAENPWLFYAPDKRIIVSLPIAAGGAAQIAGVQSGTGTQTGAIVTEIQAAGIQLGLGSQSGMLSAAVTLAGTVSGVGTQSGDLLTRIELTGQQLGAGLQALSLSSGISLAGLIAGEGAASGGIVTTISLGGQQLADSLISGGIASSISIAGQQFGAGAQAGQLGGGPALIGGSQAGAGAQSLVLSTSITLTGQQIADAILSGGLTTEIRIGGIVGGVAVISGSLDTVIPVSGTVLGAGQVAGSIQAGQIVWSMSTARRLAVPAAARRLAVPAAARRLVVPS